VKDNTLLLMTAELGLMVMAVAGLFAGQEQLARSWVCSRAI